MWHLFPRQDPRWRIEGPSRATVSGRYPGLQDLMHRLPGNNPSGVSAHPRLLTVAGAAQDSASASPVSRLTPVARNRPGHLKRTF